MATAATAAVVTARNKYLRALRQAGATDLQHGRSLAELGLKDSRIFRRMVRSGYIMMAPGAYCLNVERIAEQRRLKRKLALILIVAVAAGLVAAAILGSAR